MEETRNCTNSNQRRSGLPRGVSPGMCMWKSSSLHSETLKQAWAESSPQLAEFSHTWFLTLWPYSSTHLFLEMNISSVFPGLSQKTQLPAMYWPMVFLALFCYLLGSIRSGKRRKNTGFILWKGRLQALLKTNNQSQCPSTVLAFVRFWCSYICVINWSFILDVFVLLL